MEDINIIVSPNQVFFYTHPPKQLLKLLREKYGLRFRGKVVYCG
jgi:hypothetical protein